ncbi:MAG TPA: adenylate/guanylate cyclase domain-containing protein [Bosea sp. (in: a-proteobacteria)]|jgi:adenylate cyclase|uniref:adenylate/guanylate cyclase domain-containing protein n=1 Tax=Bosea sp. (in: a-proteobacteria) TaxID=1871050 RepID=UPI002E0EBF17|nr:adenylate/guanylate cyclase domain-containing protein [Bosea sp. (in: a-proteobacteria)]
MGEEHVPRRLAAILAADVVSYTRLMEADEQGTLARLKSLHRDVLQPEAGRHGGRIFKTIGDGVLIEFASAVDAVRGAIEIQRSLALPGEGIAAKQRLALRIGISLGDVIVEGDDLYGNGVNVAVRMQTLAAPGGICISGNVHEHLGNALDIAFDDLGEQAVKNLDRPIRCYRVSDAALKPGDRIVAAPALPDEPSIAVLPFDNLSGAAEQDYFADGITEDIITALSRLRWLFVIARNSTFSYKGRGVDVRQVARELGVRYVLEGSVRAAGQRIRITGQLIDAQSGKHLWAEKYDRDLTDVFVVQDEITNVVVATIEPHLYAAEGARAAGKTPGNIDAWGLAVRAMGLINKVGRRQNDEAQTLLRQAISLDPGYARAHALLGWAIWWASLCYWVPETREGYAQAARHAEVGLTCDPGDPWARMTFGLCLSTAGQHERALAELRAALELNPSFALGRSAYGWGLLRSGRYDDAVAETGKAIRMSPLDSFAGIYTAIHGLALLGARRFEEALPHLRRSVAAFTEYSGHYNTLISCCGHLGLIEEAQEFIAARARVGPPLRLSVLRQNLGKFAHCEVFVEGLKKAGVPE